VIDVNHALCAGCGICVDECPIGAISLVDDIAQVDADLCDGCGECIHICPNHALAWVVEPVPERAGEFSSLVVVESPVKVIPRETREPIPWRRAIFPVVGGALSWVGREVVPRIAPLALDLLDDALDRRLIRWSRDQDVTAPPTGSRQGRGRRQRYRHRRGRSSK
jgi:Pyruvate/2-oxoacid:ferredoxin oxidoreductase delta subunit